MEINILASKYLETKENEFSTKNDSNVIITNQTLSLKQANRSTNPVFIF
jgi:hypothetical protein